MPAEIELKLSISPENVPKLARIQQLKSATRGRAVTTKLYSIYYDTPEFALRDQGAALRLRRAGSRWVQTLKTAGRVEAGLHQRDELETPLPAQILNYTVLAQSNAVPLLADPELPLKLRPVFVTEFKRTTRQLEPVAGSKIEFCLDRGAVSAGDARLPISEIELELKSGPPLALLDFALGLLEQVPLRLEAASKAERGYALAEGLLAAPVKASAPLLQPVMSVTEAFRTVVFTCIAHLQANERGLLEADDAEYLHQARVALRRLRSALSVFNRAFPRAAFEQQIAELRWLGGFLGPARDWDVFATETLPAVCAAFPGEAGLHWLIERTAELRAGADASAREAVASARYTALLLKLTGVLMREPWLQLADDTAAAQRSQPLLEFAAGMLAQRQKKLLKSGHHVAELDPAGLHALRIEIKKLRYAAEFFSALYEKKDVREYLNALAALQELLGGLNDAATVERLLEPLRETEGSGQRLEGVGLLRGWTAASTRAHLNQLPAAWERFRQCGVFWKSKASGKGVKSEG
jgi:inorganic triphosphatase YgiF